MPISSPTPRLSPARHRPASPHRTHRRLLPLAALLLPALLLAAACSLSAQSMARPGLAGTRASTDTWWSHAVFYQIAPPAPVDFKALSVRLDALRSLGVDALLLPAPTLPAPGSNGAMPNLDDLDHLLRQASAHGIRVVLTIEAPASAANLTGLARFWLTRGVAGLHLATPAGTTPEATQAMVLALRKLESTVPGQRIVLSDLDLAPPTAPDATRSASRASASHAARISPSVAQLQIDSRAARLPAFDAASLRPIFAQALGQPNLLLDLRPPAAQPNPHPPLADVVAALALIIQPATLIDSGANLVLEPTPEPAPPAEPAEPAAKPTPPPAPPPGVYLPYVPYVPPPKPRPVEPPKPRPVTTDPLTLWYRQLAALHHDNPALRFGSKTFLDFDAQDALVWVNRPPSPSPQNPPVVVVCNLSASPLQLSLTAAIKKLDLHGFFLRALLRSDHGMGAQDLDSVTLPPFSVYIGELRR